MRLRDLAEATAKELAEHPERADWPVRPGHRIADSCDSPCTFGQWGDAQAYIITYPPVRLAYNP